MTKPNDPVFLQKPEIWYADRGFEKDFHYGLTKREFFAGIAMQALTHRIGEGPLYSPTVIAQAAIRQADALILELNKEPNP